MGLAFAVGCGGNSASNTAAAPAPVQTANGEALFQQNCARCHGAQGRGGAGPAPKLAGTAMDAASIKTVILNGKGRMPKIQVSDTDAQSIADYVTKLPAS
jgi:cytochrome c551